MQRADVKLLAKLNRILREIIPANPEARDFWLEDDLSKFRRTKRFGLPDRYRLFWAFSTRLRVTMVLYLNDEQTLRKHGSTNDPYSVFKRLTQQGELGSDVDVNWRIAQDDLNEKKKGPRRGSTKHPGHTTSTHRAGHTT